MKLFQACKFTKQNKATCPKVPKNSASNATNDSTPTSNSKIKFESKTLNFKTTFRIGLNHIFLKANVLDLPISVSRNQMYGLKTIEHLSGLHFGLKSKRKFNKEAIKDYQFFTKQPILLRLGIIGEWVSIRMINILKSILSAKARIIC